MSLMLISETPVGPDNLITKKTKDLDFITHSVNWRETESKE